MTKNNMSEVLLIGLPNSGKSSLVNALCGKKVSIIGSTPNTTRDKISSTIKRDDKVFNISDLPGYLEDPDELNEKFQKNYRTCYKREFFTNLLFRHTGRLDLLRE